MAVPEHIARDLENHFAGKLMWTRRNLNQADIVATTTERMLMIVWLMMALLSAYLPIDLLTPLHHESGTLLASIKEVPISRLLHVPALVVSVMIFKRRDTLDPTEWLGVYESFATHLLVGFATLIVVVKTLTR
jgi:hypothetical protein